MGTMKHDAVEHFKLISWVLFVLYLFLAALALIFGRQAGYGTMAWICLVFGLLITMVFGGLFAINLFLAWIAEVMRRFRRNRTVP